ncbi:response regulator [Blastopirellula sp. JC732]|uniref:Response regulator n=1 Tax=Blastopirellula sediminis TaxID=2894196 RepID=A0A9X1MQC4_9BACT|nr:response regulator [Blastopirellula sediminis]MCC9607048.1 response regulator [Blastopirellula sediminis]MCC9629659.1 response regulator [Blastopirellula sediminis]
MPTTPTVFIIDDDPAARESIGMLIDSLGLKTEQFSSAEEFLSAFSADRCGCVITDVRMLGLSGVELQERLLAVGYRIPVILITAHANTQTTVRAMRNGAVTFLDKPCKEQEIVDAVNEAIALDAKWRAEDIDKEEAERLYQTCTEGEKDVMRLMVQGKANKVIARRLDVSLRTVEARRHNVFKKMGVDNVPDLVRLAIRLEQDIDSTGGEDDDAS